LKENNMIFRVNKKETVEPTIVKETFEKELKIPIKPILYGDKFKIKISTDQYKSSSMANALHNISRFGIKGIDASDDIENYIRYYLVTMSKQFSAETLEKLSNDYNSSVGDYSITFELNKNQAIEFMDLIEKASRGVSI